MCASRKVSTFETCGRNESKGFLGKLRWEGTSVRRVLAPSTDWDVQATVLKDLSKSAHAGTRKMVNYA